MGPGRKPRRPVFSQRGSNAIGKKNYVRVSQRRVFEHFDIKRFTFIFDCHDNALIKHDRKSLRMCVHVEVNMIFAEDTNVSNSVLYIRDIE